MEHGPAILLPMLLKFWMVIGRCGQSIMGDILTIPDLIYFDSQVLLDIIDVSLDLIVTNMLDNLVMMDWFTHIGR